MVDLRKIVIIFVIAVLFAILVFAVIGAVYPTPKYDDYCKSNPYYYGEPVKVDGTAYNCTYNPTPADRKACDERKGYMEAVEFDTNGCPSKYECNTCQIAYEDANEKYRLYVFYISAFLALIAIFVGLFLPSEQNTLNEWMGTGFMLGGTFALFFGTAFSYTALGRYIKPAVIFLELALIIFISYKKLSDRKEHMQASKRKR